MHAMGRSSGGRLEGAVIMDSEEHGTSAGIPRITELVRALHMERHPEGGWFAETYTAPVSFAEGEKQRALAGSIYYLLEGKDISAFHQIDCDELWYYHEGTGMRLYVLKQDGTMAQYRLGNQLSQGELPMVRIAAGEIFAAENLEQDGYTLISCVTAPKFRYEGWRLVQRDELLARCPAAQEWERFSVSG